MKDRFWKKTLAACFALMIVAGGMPVQPFAQVLDRAAITANAVGNTMQETIDINSNGELVYYGDYCTITGMVGDEDGMDVGRGNTIVIESDEYIIDRIEMSVGFGEEYADQTVSSNGKVNVADDKKSTTIEDINSASVTISSMSSKWLQYSSVTIYCHEVIHEPFDVIISGGANAAANAATEQKGVTKKISTVTYTANEGYHFEHFDSYTVNDITMKWVDKKTVTISGTPTGDTQILVPDAINEWKVSISDSIRNGSVSTEKEMYEVGETVDLNVSVDKEEYQVSSITVNNGTVDITDNGDGTYSFIMPDEDVTVTAEILLTTIKYIDENGEEVSTKDFTLLTGNETRLEEGVYYSDNDITFRESSGVIIKGDVKLILADGVNINFGSEDSRVNYGYITASYDTDTTLSIYGQEQGTGTLNVFSRSWCILYGSSDALFTINQYGGNVNLDTTDKSAMLFDYLNIYGGTFNAISGGNTLKAVFRSDVESGNYRNGEITIKGGNVNIKTTDPKTAAVGAENIYLSLKNEDDSICFYGIDGGIEIPEGEALYCGTKRLVGDEPNYEDIAGKLLTTVPYYPVNISDSIENGKITVDKGSAAVGKTVTLTATPDENYKLISVTVTDEDGKEVEVENNQFTMPLGGVNITAEFEFLGHAVSIADGIEYGNITADRSNAKMDEEVILTVTPAEGYRLKSLSVNILGDTLNVTKIEDGTYSFFMPDGNVEIRVEFVPEPVSVTYVDADGQTQTVQATPLKGYEKLLDEDIYVVNSEITYSEKLTFSGDTLLILDEDNIMTANCGISVTDEGTLTVTGSGTLNVNGKNGADGEAGKQFFDGEAGGDGEVGIDGNLTILSGNVNVCGGNGGNGGDAGRTNTGSRYPITNGGKGGNGGTGVIGIVNINGGEVCISTGSGGTGGQKSIKGSKGKSGTYSVAVSGELHSLDDPNFCVMHSYNNSNWYIPEKSDDIYQFVKTMHVFIPDEMEFVKNHYGLYWHDSEINFRAKDGYAVSNVAVGEYMLQPDENGVYYIGIDDENVTVTAETEVIDTAFRAHNLVLDGEIGVNFYVSLKEVLSDGAYMSFTIKGKTVTQSITDADKVRMNGIWVYRFTCNVTAIEMAETINAVLHFGDDQTISEEYSVQKYIDSCSAKDYDETTMQLINAIADYGSYVQPFLAEANGFDDYAVMNAKNEYTEEDVANAKEALTDYKLKGTNNNSDILKLGYSLNLKSKTTLEVMMLLPEGYSGKIRAEVIGDLGELEVKQVSDTVYSVKIENIPAHNLGKNYWIVFYTDSGEWTTDISALTYAYKEINNPKNEYAEKAMTALYNYYNATYAYRRAH